MAGVAYFLSCHKQTQLNRVCFIFLFSFLWCIPCIQMSKGDHMAQHLSCLTDSERP